MADWQWLDDDNSQAPQEDLLSNLSLLQSKLTEEFFNIDGGDGPFCAPYLIKACQTNNIPAAQLLLDHQANPNIGYNGETPLHILFKTHPTSPIIAQLIQHKANLFDLGGNHNPAILQCPIKFFSIHRPIIQESFKENIEIIFLLRSQIKSTLIIAIKRNKQSHLKEILQIFSEIGAIAYIFPTDEEKLVLLRLALQNNQNSSMVELLENHLNFRESNSTLIQMENLISAIKSGSESLVHSILSSSGERLDFSKFDAESVLHTAVRNNQVEILKLLLQTPGVDPRWQSCLEEDDRVYPELGKLYNDSALHVAARKGFSQCAQELIRVCPDLLLQVNHWGNIPLHVACFSGSLDTLSVLLNSFGENQVNLQNGKGDSPLHYLYRYWKFPDFNSALDLFRYYNVNETLRNANGYLAAPPDHKNSPKRTGSKDNLRNSGNRGGRQNQKRGGKKSPKNPSFSPRNQQKTENLPIKSEEKASQPVPEPQPPNKPAAEDLEDLHSCQICFENPRNALIQPCNHLVACKPCADDIRSRGHSCPICRNPITAVIEIFVS